MKVNAGTVEEYLQALPADRRADLSAVRDVVRRNLPDGFVECLQCGMISYVIPLTRHPHTYNRQPLAIVSLGAQKHHLAIYLMCIYGDTKTRAWFEAEYRKSGKKLDVGKACVRFKTRDDLPLDLIAKTVARASAEDLIRVHDAAQSQRPHRRPARTSPKRSPRQRIQGP